MTNLIDTAKLMLEAAQLGGRPQHQADPITYTLQLSGAWWTLSLSRLTYLPDECDRKAAREAFGIPEICQTEIDQRKTVRGIWQIVRYRWPVAVKGEQPALIEAPAPEERSGRYYRE